MVGRLIRDFCVSGQDGVVIGRDAVCVTQDRSRVQSFKHLLWMSLEINVFMNLADLFVQSKVHGRKSKESRISQHLALLHVANG